MLTKADKITNFYRMKPDTFNKLLHNVTKTYKKIDNNLRWGTRIRQQNWDNCKKRAIYHYMYERPQSQLSHQSLVPTDKPNKNRNQQSN